MSPSRDKMRWPQRGSASGRVVRVLLIGFLSCASTWQAAAMTLSDAYQAALSADPKYQADRHERDAGLFAVPLARSQLLPSLSYSASSIRYNGYREFPTNAGPQRQDQLYSAPQQALNLKLSLYNAENLRSYDQAKKQAEYSELIFATREVDLIDRLGTAYLQALLSSDDLRLNDAQITALEAQARSADRRFTDGEGTRTEIAESQSRLDSAIALRIDTRAALEIARLNLKNIVGQDAGVLSQPKADFLPAEMKPATADEWLVMAYANSPTLAARRVAVEVADAAIARNRAGHLPKLDLVAGISRSRSETSSTVNQELSQKFVGFQLVVPLYAGGYVTALTDQSIASAQRAQSDLEAERTNIEVIVRRTFLACANGAGRVTAYMRAVAASEVALEGTRRAFLAGIRPNADVLDAERQVFSTRRDLAQARYDYLIARLRLQSASGLDAGQIIDDISRLLPVQP